MVGPETAAVTHFGRHGEVAARVEELREALVGLAARVEEALAAGTVDEDARAFDREARERIASALPRERVDRYLDVFSAATDYRGMQRYVERHPDWRDA